MASNEIAGICRLIRKAAEQGALKKAVLSKPDSKEILKTVLTVKLIAGKKMLQAEIFTRDNKARHENIEISDAEALFGIAEGFSQINVITTAGDCEYKRSKNGKETLIGAKKVENSLPGAQTIDAGGNDREKNYILNGSEPFLIHLGVSDKNGRVHDKKRPKFRQINRFLEHIRDVMRHLPTEGELRVCDLCCGKSYLSFAVYHYLKNVLGREVKMTGVDLKGDVIEYCNSVARALEWDGLEFFCMDIMKYETETPPHLVISLHACDIATDIVLRKAAMWQTDVILSTPCCHHELNQKLDCPELEFISKYSMLRQKLSDAATDALRLMWLESEGYACDALELIDPDDTPKNILLRAIRHKKADPAKKAEKAKAEYYKTREFLIGSGILGGIE